MVGQIPAKQEVVAFHYVETAANFVYNMDQISCYFARILEDPIEVSEEIYCQHCSVQY